MIRLYVICALVWAMGGCANMDPTPFIAVEHKSDPWVDNDGWDLACLGGKLRGDQLTVKAAGCINARGGGNIANLGIEYDFIPRSK